MNGQNQRTKEMIVSYRAYQDTVKNDDDLLDFEEWLVRQYDEVASRLIIFMEDEIRKIRKRSGWTGEEVASDILNDIKRIKKGTLN